MFFTCKSCDRSRLLLQVVYKSEAVFLKEALVRIVASSTGQEEEEEEEEEKNGKEGEGEKEGERDAMKAMELLTQCLDKIKVGP